MTGRAHFNIKLHFYSLSYFFNFISNDESWKHCKYLGSNLGTEEDIQRRKALAIATYNKMKHIIENKKTSRITIKRIFKTYIESVLLYNSELWSMNRKLEDDIDVFQRNQIRRALKID